MTVYLVYKVYGSTFVVDSGYLGMEKALKKLVQLQEEAGNPNSAYVNTLWVEE